MPVYTFKCTECEAEFDELTHDNKIEEIECNCEKKKKCKKIFSSISKPIFKGTGFYETDYKKS